MNTGLFLIIYYRYITEKYSRLYLNNSAAIGPNTCQISGSVLTFEILKI